MKRVKRNLYMITISFGLFITLVFLFLIVCILFFTSFKDVYRRIQDNRKNDRHYRWF